MILEAVNGFIYGSIFLSLFLIDYILGNGFVDMFQTMFCKIVCFVRKTIREEAKQSPVVENPINLSMLFTEILILSMTVANTEENYFCRMVENKFWFCYDKTANLNSLLVRRAVENFLNKYKQYRGKDRIDELLQESKDALKQTNEFLEKWRLRRINWQVPTEYSYLDDEPQEIKPLKLEVPILHMAIIDTLGTTRSQPERGDAGDAINITDSTLLSVTSLLDDDIELPHESEEKIVENENKNVEFSNRYLWDVMEEDTNSSEED